MTQRVARPMKFAAFISIIISVAVMLAACQGAVGKPGDKGDKGDKGDTGTSGQSGAPGVSQLVALPSPAPILINDARVDGEAAVGTIPTDLTAASYFRGGKAPLTYTWARTDANGATDNITPNTFNLVAAKDGAITISMLPAAELAEPSYDPD